MTLGNAIKVVRTAAGLKQRYVAEKLAVSPNYVSLVEAGKRQPSLAFLNRLANLLGIPVGIFFLWQEFDPRGLGPDRLDQLRQLVARMEGFYLVSKGRGPRRKTLGR